MPAPSHHHAAVMASAVMANDASAGPTAFALGREDTGFALALTARCAKMRGPRHRCALDKSAQLGCSHRGFALTRRRPDCPINWTRETSLSARDGLSTQSHHAQPLAPR